MPAVLITGAGSGIGRAAALQFAQAGWNCILVDISDAIKNVAEKCLQEGASGAKSYQLDLTDANAMARMCNELPALDALINNAGLSDTSGMALVAQGPEQLNRLVRLNLEAPRCLFEACSALLLPGARVVNVASGAGLKAIPWRGMYSATKAGLIAMTRGWAKAFPQWGISVLCPGFVRTELVQTLIDSKRLVIAEAVAKIPMGRLADPDEMAAAIVLLAQPAACFFSGQLLSVDGGSSIYGGSKPCVVSAVSPVALHAAQVMQVQDAIDTRWANLALPSTDAVNAYLGAVSARALALPPNGHLAATVLASAKQFLQIHRQNAGLVVLLPAGHADDWRYQTELATARMLVATLACEWGAQALRINALVVDAGQSTESVGPFVQYLAGPRAQFVTGQTLDITAQPIEVAHG